MNYHWILILLIFNEVCGFKKCPTECICNLDSQNRNQMLCTKTNVKSFQINLMDKELQVIVLKIQSSLLNELSKSLQSFRKLELLKLYESSLPTLGKYTFWGLPNLKILDLAKNNISIITEENFRGQDNLLQLDLSKNKIFKIPTNVFHYLKSLNSLKLSENFIDVLHDRPFFMLTSLTYLDLSGNMLQDLPPEVFKDVQELKTLKCRRCQLKNINPQLYNLLNSLNNLDLGDNQFKYLIRDEFNDLKNLKILKLDGNQLSVIVDYIFLHQLKLNYLDISRNRLAKITNNAFYNLTNLTYLDLSYNKLTKLEAISMKPLNNLEILNISGNIQLDLSEIRPTFQVLQDLTTLSIADMGSLPIGLLMPLGQLNSLNLSGNQFDDTSLKILNPLFNLKFLDLTRNQLNGIENFIALKLININDVRLEFNPIICDRCHMGPIINRSKDLRWHPQSLCFLPESLRGFYITEIAINDLEECIELTIDEDHDAASTSHNFLDQKGMGTLIVFGGIVFIIVAGIAFTAIMCFLRTRGQKRKFSLVEQQNIDASIGKSLNQPISLSSSTTTTTTSTENEEKHIKFSLQPSICTIDEIFIPEPPPPPAKKSVQFKKE